MNEQIITTTRAVKTKRLAYALAKKILKNRHQKPAIIIALSGNLGSGKTTFVQGFAKELGIKEIPKSPTFILMQIFPIPPKSYKLKAKSLIHIDAYRLEKPKELIHLGLKEILRDPHNIVIIEWAEKVKALLPKDAIWISFRHAGKDKRHIAIKSQYQKFAPSANSGASPVESKIVGFRPKSQTKSKSK